MVGKDTSMVAVFEYSIFEWDYDRDPSDTLFAFRLVLDPMMDFPFFKQSNVVIRDSVAGNVVVQGDSLWFALHVNIRDGITQTITSTSRSGNTVTTRSFEMPPALITHNFSILSPGVGLPPRERYHEGEVLKRIGSGFPQSEAELETTEPERNYELFLHHRLYRLPRAEVMKTHLAPSTIPMYSDLDQMGRPIKGTWQTW